MTPLISFILFAFVASITPGPTNIIILIASSVKKPTTGFILGACTTAAALILVVGFGVSDLLVRYPLLKTIMTGLGISWLTYLAWKIFYSSHAINTQHHQLTSSINFISGATLQLVNPKTWLMVISVVSIYLNTTNYIIQLIIHALIFFIISIPCLFCWTWLGIKATKYINTEKSMKVFNQVMAIVLLIATWSMLLT